MEAAPQFDLDVFKAHNEIRTDPKSFIAELEAMLPGFEGNLFKRPGSINLMTNEGPAAVQECIEFLKKQEAMPALTWS